MKSNPLRWVMLGAVTVLTGIPLMALDADFDDKKPVTLKGVATRYEWNNPNVLIDLDVTDAKGAVTTWAVLLASTSELKSAGWTRESVRVGDVITVEGRLARDGSKRASGKT